MTHAIDQFFIMFTILVSLNTQGILNTDVGILLIIPKHINYDLSFYVTFSSVGGFERHFYCVLYLETD